MVCEAPRSVAAPKLKLQLPGPLSTVLEFAPTPTLLDIDRNTFAGMPTAAVFGTSWPAKLTLIVVFTAGSCGIGLPAALSGVNVRVAVQEGAAAPPARIERSLMPSRTEGRYDKVKLGSPP